MDLGLEDRVAVVLASTAGLGLGVAKSLAREGARVAACGRDPARLEAARAALVEVAGDAGRVLAEPLDVTRGEELEAHLDRVRARFGRLDVLVANTGGPPPAGALEVTAEGLVAAAEGVLHPAVRAIAKVLPWMRAAGWGRVLAMTSIAVREPVANLAYSNTMRAGLTAYLKTLASEVGRDGVTVNSVCTGLFATARLEGLLEARATASGRSAGQERAAAEAGVPLGRLGDPDEFGDFVAFLVSERASYLNGAAIALDGGLSRGLL